MGKDCVRWCQELLPVQLEAGNLKSPPYLWPTLKSTQPFHTWAVDLVSHLGSGRAAVYLIVAVCTFSKWVEGGVLPDKSATTVAKWFHFNITCRFGTPVCVRTDRGGEFKGVFGHYLARLGVR